MAWYNFWRKPTEPQSIPVSPDRITNEPLVKKEVKQLVSEQSSMPTLPAKTGRSSMDENYNGLGSSMNQLSPDFPIEYLHTLQFLAAFDSDVSYAVDNICTIANTEHEIKFDSSIKESMAQEMHRHLLAVRDKWYNFSSGIDSLSRDLFAQLVINGCISAEAYPNDKMNGIEAVVKVSPVRIRFTVDENRNYIPNQLLNTGIFHVSTNLGLKPLNPLTYSYIAYRRYSKSPYAVPPFLPVFSSMVPEKHLKDNFKNIAKKLGAFGFFAAYLNVPERKEGESDKQYLERAVLELQTYAPEFEKSLGNGFVVGFKDQHEFKLEGTPNGGNASDLFKQVETWKLASLKQDPNMLGRQQSTSETFGRILLAKLMMQVADYQQTVSEFFERVYMMELILAGYNPVSVSVKFKAPLIGDQLKEEQTKNLKFNRLVGLYNQGIISQTTFAKEMDYDEPFLPAPIAPVAAVGAAGDPNSGGTSPDASKKPGLSSEKKKD